MEVAELTARLKLETAGFQANLAAADAQINSLRVSMKDLEAAAEGIAPALQEIRISQMQAAESRNALTQISAALKDMRNVVMENKAALAEMGISEGQVAKFTASSAVMVEDLDRIGDEAARARREIEALDIVQRRIRPASGGPGVFAPGRMFTGGQPPSFVRGSDPTAQELADFNQAQYLASLPPDRSVGTYRARLAQLLDEQRSAGGGIMMGPGSTLRDFGPRRALGFGEEGLGPFMGGSRRTFPFISEEEAALGEGGTAVEREARRVARDGGGGRRSSSFGFLSGILPGGRRAGAGVVTAGIGLAGAVGPAAVPALVGLGAAGTAGLEALMGGAATLKLAFADLSSAVFTNKKKFDELTPVQQQFVLTLKSIDTGFMKPLERLAQQNVLPGLTAALHSALSPAAVVAARGAVSGFGGAISGGTQELGRLVGSTDFARAFGSVMATDAHILRDMFSALAHVIDAFFRLQQAAGPLVLWLDKGALAFTKWFDGAIKAAQASGSLAHFFGEAKTALQALGDLVGAVAGALHSASEALGGFQLAIGIITTLTHAFDILGSFLNANRATLRSFFQGALQSINDVLGLIRQLMRLLTPLLTLLNAIARAFGGWRVVIDAAMAVFALKFVLGLKVVQSLEAALLGIGPAATAGVGAADVQLALFNAQAGRGVGMLARLRLGLLGLATPELLAGLAAVAGVLASSGAAPNVPGFPKKGTAATVAGLAASGKIPEAVLRSAAQAAGLDPNTPAGTAMQNQAFVNYLTAWATNHGLLSPAGPSAASADALAKAAHGAGMRPPQFKEPGIETPYLSMLLANAQATPSFTDDKAVIRRIVAVLEARKRETNSPQTKTQLQDAINNYNLQLQSSSPFGSPGGFTNTPTGRKPSALDQVLPQHLQAAISAGETNLVSARAALQGAQSPQEQIKASQDLIRVAKEYEAQIQRSLDHLRAEHETGKLLVAQKREELALTRQQVAAEKDVHTAMLAQANARANIRAEHILGLGAGGATVLPNIQRLMFRERQVLTRQARRARLDTDRFPHENLDQIIRDMQRQGFHFPEQSLSALERINKAMGSFHKGQKASEDVLTKIRDILSQVDDTLKNNLAGAHSNLRQMDPMGIVNRLVPGASRAQKLGLIAAISAGQVLHQGVPSGGAAAGVPLPSGVGGGYDVPTRHPHHVMPGRAPELVSEHGRWQGAKTYNNYTVKIVIDGSRTAQQIAREVRTELLRNQRRNGAQTKGPNAGRGVGLG